MTLALVPRRLHAATFPVARTAAALRAWWRGNGVSAYWYVGARNFGDRLTPLLLEHYGLTPVHARAARSRVVLVGSVLGRFPPDYEGVVLGAGLLEDVRHPLPRATVLGVRGRLTGERIDAPSDVVLGDPGLLAPRLFPRPRTKTAAVGLVPHYVDRRDPRLLRLASRLAPQVTVIDVTRPPHQVLRAIDQCEHVLSSSLHGVVVADGLGVPNAWVALSDQVIGADFKFRDYGSAVARTLEPGRLSGAERLRDLIDLTTSPPPAVAVRQRQLHQVFQTLKSRVVA